MKMWSGRFRGSLDETADAFNSSLPFDSRLYKHDILGSIAHATMLGETGIIEKAEADAICTALSEIFYDIKSGALPLEGAEDIHMFVEEKLTERIGDAGKKLHTARSRNDQVALDIRLYLRDSVTEIKNLLKALCLQLIAVAKENYRTYMPAYTHMQKAQPTTLAHYVMAYAEMFMRDIDRLSDCRKRINVMPLGSGACTGTSFPIDRERVAQLLDFPTVTANSLDSVSDRDFIVEFLNCAALIMTHLSRFNEELVYWSTEEFGFVEPDDAFSTGSSIMPQKKNPDISELIRGKTGRVYGDLTAILTVLKGLPLAYNKDMQEDKEAVFDAEDTVKSCLTVFTAMIPTLHFKTDVMNKGAAGGYTAATDCADYLVRKGLPFREAHAVVGKLVLYASDAKKPLHRLTADEFRLFSPLFGDDIMDTVKIHNVVNCRKLTGGPAHRAVAQEVRRAERFLAKI